jgi:hypothetical protein
VQDTHSSAVSAFSSSHALHFQVFVDDAEDAVELIEKPTDGAGGVVAFETGAGVGVAAGGANVTVGVAKSA